MDTIEFSQNRLTSPFAMASFMNDINKWDNAVKKIQALKPVGIHSLQVAGRFDIAALSLYDEPLLDWVLIIYNGFKHIGDFGTLITNQTIPLSLGLGQSITIDEPLQHSTLQIKVGNVFIPTFLSGGQTKADTNGDYYNDITISYNDTGAFVEADDIHPAAPLFTLVFPIRSSDNSLDTGTDVVYPSKADIKTALKVVTEEQEKTVEGFARL